MAKEPATYSTGIEVRSAQIFIPPPSCRLRFDARQKLFEPFGRLSRRLHRPTALARPITGRERITD
jgi:hypothetical protein